MDHQLCQYSMICNNYTDRIFIFNLKYICDFFLLQSFFFYLIMFVIFHHKLNENYDMMSFFRFANKRVIY
jgi:hypothetical protein